MFEDIRHMRRNVLFKYEPSQKPQIRHTFRNPSREESLLTWVSFSRSAGRVMSVFKSGAGMAHTHLASPSVNAVEYLLLQCRWG